MLTVLIGFFRYEKEGVKKACLILRTSQIDAGRGDGYNVKNYFVNEDILPKDLHAGKVEVKLDDWNNNILREIKNA